MNMDVLMIVGFILSIIAFTMSIILMIKKKWQTDILFLSVMLYFAHVVIYYTYFVFFYPAIHPIIGDWVDFIRRGGWGNIVRMQLLVTAILTQLYLLLQIKTDASKRIDSNNEIEDRRVEDAS
jgi:hypothetical protein